VASGGKTARGVQYLLYADEDLISLAATSDAGAFAALYDRHARAAYSLAYRMMGEKQAAEDIAQEAFIKVWHSAESYRAERGSVRTWILSIVHNRGIDQLRSMASRRRMLPRNHCLTFKGWSLSPLPRNLEDPGGRSAFQALLRLCLWWVSRRRPAKPEAAYPWAVRFRVSRSVTKTRRFLSSTPPSNRDLPKARVTASRFAPIMVASC
jgi:RNA polymerase sigma factor (sigma-70 family)